ncbi:MAG: hypothetical protein AVDCRST_MAG40-953, partial [uncultured Gemmatimonadaceae bacterium]
PVAAQRPDSAPPRRADTTAAALRARVDSLRSARFCRGQRITRIDVEPSPPAFPRLFRRIPVLRDIDALPHTTTRPQVVRNFLAVREGEPCTELRRAESERILRAQPFIAGARVLAFPDSSDGVRLVVETTDELSNVLGLAASGVRPTVVRFGDGNVGGQGLYATGLWREGFGYRDGYGARVVAYQLLGRPYQLSAEYLQRPVGGRRTADFSHPFLTDLQRVAWRASAGSIDQQFAFTRDGVDASSLIASRQYWDVGGVVRLGAPGRLSLFGASLTRETEFTDGAPVQYRREGPLPDTSSLLVERYARTQNARVNALWGVRNVRFLRVEGFDALAAEQDVRTGFQFGTLLGRSVSVLGSTDDDIFTAADVYTGMGSPRSFLAFQAQGEGRQDGDTERWDAILAAGRAAWYLKPHPRHTFITSTEFTGGWRQRVPFQLVLSDREGGLRGYRQSRTAGGQRLVARAEERWRLGVFRSADFGISGFVDAGKLWAGDAPYGATTPVRYGAGIGILASPRRSQKLYRVELGFPVSPDRHARFELRVRTTDAASTTFWVPPDDVRRSRGRTLPTSVFTWP